MRVYLYLFLLATTFSTISYAQNRQLYFEKNKLTIKIYDSKVDMAGNVISVGAYLPPGTYYPNDYKPLLIKTDRAGNRIWERVLDFANSHAIRVKIAANGDYLVLIKDSWPGILRTSPSGVLISTTHYTYANTVNDNITGFAELPNGRFAICGYNDFDYSNFSSSIQWQGFLLIADSTSYPITLKSYGQSNSFINDNYLFNDVALIGNRLVIVGEFRNYENGASRGLVLSTDLTGGNTSTYISPVSTTYGATSYGYIVYKDIVNVQNQLFINGFLSGAFPNASIQIIGKTDTNSYSFNGVGISLQPGTTPSNPCYFVQDTNNWYFANQPTTSTNFYVPGKIFFGKISNGIASQTKRLYQDSIITLNSLTVIGDTAIITGTTYRNKVYQGYLASYNMAAPSSQLCNITDTTVQVGNLSITAAAPSTPPVVLTQNPSGGLVLISLTTPCINDMHLCGTAPCPAITAGIQAITPTSVCDGDTVKLVSGNCFHTTWYRNNVPITDTTDTLSVTLPGDYSVVAGNGLCFDTSAIIHVIVHHPIPTISQLHDTLKVSPIAYSYQWLDSNGSIISGATNPYFVPSNFGNYSVYITDSFGCHATSPSFLYMPAQAVGNINHQGSDITIYPNPADDHFTISQHTGAPIRLSIWSESGRLIKKTDQRAANYSYSSDNLGLQPGLYFIVIETRAETIRYKLAVTGRH